MEEDNNGQKHYNLHLRRESGVRYMSRTTRWRHDKIRAENEAENGRQYRPQLEENDVGIRNMRENLDGIFLGEVREDNSESSSEDDSSDDDDDLYIRPITVEEFLVDVPDEDENNIPNIEEEEIIEDEDENEEDEDYEDETREELQELLSKGKRLTRPPTGTLSKFRKSPQISSDESHESDCKEIENSAQSKKEVVAAKKQKSKEERSRKVDAQMSVMENLQKKLDVDQTKIQVSMANWSKQSSLLASLQAQLRRYKEETKNKSKIIQDLQESNSKLRVIIERKLDTVILQGKGAIIDAGVETCSASTNANASIGLSNSRSVDEVELASGLFVNKFGLEAIRYNKKMKPSRVVRNLVTLIFTRDEILNQSITGKECNFKKEGNRKAATQRLDEWKINVVKDELRRILCERKYSADNVNKEVLNVEKYIRSKLSTEKQAIKKHKQMTTRPKILS
ncbi:nucleolin-like [Belonocnema kinseyi]|uniref:nucleolin-like n=1 Tax=Belonocnema kinseyi TaxID=2817044 RepID=UPI00143DC8AA|nr:nucleolin-like [Belonocnema kinseyi]XP_033211563.1 nucleolin-like [Belonocnema kinseyi]XP_033211564.1 nucleolin-like [Belonocnema kinseyi]